MTPAISLSAAATLLGDVTIEGPKSDGMRIWLGAAVGSVNSGPYENTQIVATGTSLGIYVKRDGLRVGTIRLELGPILVAAIGAFEDIAKEQS